MSTDRLVNLRADGFIFGLLGLSPTAISGRSLALLRVIPHPVLVT